MRRPEIAPDRKRVGVGVVVVVVFWIFWVGRRIIEVERECVDCLCSGIEKFYGAFSFS